MSFNRRFPVVSLYAPVAIALALSVAACGGGGGGGGNNAPPGDTTAPTVAVNTLPAEVNRTIEVDATASDAVGVTQVQFFVDGTSIGTDTSAPYSASWDTSTAADGAHQITAVARDAAGNSTTSAAVTATVHNRFEFAVALSGDEEIPATGSSGSATGTIDVEVTTGAVTGSITVSGFAATAAHIHDAFAGVAGGILIGLAQSNANPNLWEIPAGSTLTSEQVDRLLAGGLYINAHSVAFPAGEVRAQLLPPHFSLVFTDLTGAEVVAPVSTGGTARAATTVDTVTRKVTVNVNTSGLDTANGVHVHAAPSGQSGDIVVSLERNATTPSLWSATGIAVTAAQISDFQANDWYVDVHTPANPNGEVRGQIILQASGVTPYTFSEIQTQIFNARCIGCHSGAAAPQGLNLSAGTSYGLLVNVASSEVPSLKRVAPADADNSYIIRKLEGTAGIVGERMPFGGPYLDQSTIDRIRAWIDNGAPNN